MDQRVALRNLSDLSICFPRAFLTYGSALGAVRDSEIIEWDTDTDMGILAEDFLLESVETAQNDGFQLRKTYGTLQHGYQLCFHRDGVKTDLWLFYRNISSVKENAYISVRYNCLWDKDEELRHEYPAQLLNVERHKIGNTPFRCLGEQYLSHVYGDWQEPQKEFDWRTDHLCKT